MCIYEVGLSTIMIYKYLSVIKCQLVLLNKKLICGTPDSDSFANARRVYGQISKVVLAFNHAFGLRIFIIYSINFIGALHVASLAVRYIINESDIKLIYLMSLWSSAVLVSILKM